MTRFVAGCCIVLLFMLLLLIADGIIHRLAQLTLQLLP